MFKCYSSRTDIKNLQEAAALAGNICEELSNLVAPGIVTAELELFANRLLQQHRSLAPFKSFDGFGYATCISVNDAAVNAPPSSQVILQPGDVVKIAVGTQIGSMHGKAARTFRVPVPDELSVPEHITRLIQGPNLVFERIHQNARAYQTTTQLSDLILECANANQLSIIERSGGNGIGRRLHEPPFIPNHSDSEQVNVTLTPGCALTLMPMMALGKSGEWIVDSDGWTHRTKDGSLASHEADTLLMTDNGLINLSRPG